jgi:hypothetical protein
MNPQKLARLIDLGVLARADGVREATAFNELALDATRRRELTVGQAKTLARLLGLPSRPANDH